MSELTTYQHHYEAFGLNILSDMLLPELPVHAGTDRKEQRHLIPW